MLNSDRHYLDKFAVDPEMENQFDFIDLYFDAEIEVPTEDMALDFLFNNQKKTGGNRSNEDQTVKRPSVGGKRKRRAKEYRRDHHP